MFLTCAPNSELPCPLPIVFKCQTIIEEEKKTFSTAEIFDKPIFGIKINVRNIGAHVHDVFMDVRERFNFFFQSERAHTCLGRYNVQYLIKIKQSSYIEGLIRIREQLPYKKVPFSRQPDTALYNETRRKDENNRFISMQYQKTKKGLVSLVQNQVFRLPENPVHKGSHHKSYFLSGPTN